MPAPEHKITPLELHKNLQRLMLLRVLIVSALLGTLIFIQVRQTSAYTGALQSFYYALIISVYFLTFLYIVLIKFMRDPRRLTYIQLLVDTALITAVIFCTGGIESFFSFLYILTIFSAGVLLYRRGALIIASSSSILYGSLLDLHYYGIIFPYGSQLTPVDADKGAYILFRILAHTAAFYLIAVLSSFLSEQIRKSRDELEAKKDDIIKLEVINERIVESIASGLITLDDRDRVILFNPAAERILAFPASEANGRAVTDILPFMERKTPFLESDTLPGTFSDVSFRARDGRDLYLRVCVSSLNLSAGNEKGRILVLQDMTESKRIEKEMHRVEGLAMIGELAAGIAHEIRNPMASISGSIQMLRESMVLDEDDINNRLMEIIMREVNRLNNLINDFLRYARPRKTNFTTFDLGALVRESLDLFMNTGGCTEKILLDTSTTRSIALHSDPEQLKQVLWNIFLNARDAMPRGGTLHIEAETSDGDQKGPHEVEILELRVRDTGEGFSARALENLFTPFYTTKQEGSGLGLATVKRIVEGLGGEARGENHPSGGAQIILRLPLTRSPKEAY